MRFENGINDMIYMQWVGVIEMICKREKPKHYCMVYKAYRKARWLRRDFRHKLAGQRAFREFIKSIEFIEWSGDTTIDNNGFFIKERFYDWAKTV